MTVVLSSYLLSLLWFYENAHTVYTATTTCHGHALARYRVTFTGRWSEELFPKQYPKWRPNAQWSQLVGRSHNDEYELWSMSSVASFAFTNFVEDSNSDLLEKEGQGFNGIFDSFNAPAILKGVGETAADFLATTSHSKVSAAVRIVPSPDWFVGVSNLDLCESGVWSRNISMTLEPIDAGTDRGLTFTSPNWASHPRQRMFYITANFPRHRASSFFYPDRERNPAIGAINFQLLDEFTHNVQHANVTHTREDNPEVLLDLEDERRQEVMEEAQVLHGEPVGSTSVRTESDAQETSATDEIEPTVADVKLARSQHHPRHTDKRDCIVGHWTAWSACTKTCGFGVQKRSREVLQTPRSGQSCPIVEEERWCGSMRKCQVKHFEWVPAPRE